MAKAKKHIFRKWIFPTVVGVTYFGVTATPAVNVIGKASKPLVQEALACLYMGSVAGATLAAAYTMEERINNTEEGITAEDALDYLAKCEAAKIKEGP